MWKSIFTLLTQHGFAVIYCGNVLISKKKMSLFYWNIQTFCFILQTFVSYIFTTLRHQTNSKFISLNLESIIHSGFCKASIIPATLTFTYAFGNLLFFVYSVDLFRSFYSLFILCHFYRFKALHRLFSPPSFAAIMNTQLFSLPSAYQLSKHWQ